MMVNMSRPDPISIRIPEALRTAIQTGADSKGRSLNAEIRMRLQWSVDNGFDGATSDAMLANEVESLRGEIRSGITNLQAEIATLKAEVAELKRRSAQ